MEMELPDLSAFSSPLDKALVLLHTAVEIEHMLMVQYLYASFSLREAEEAGGLEPENNPARIALLEEWRSTLMNIGQQEMGHLMTVQSLLNSGVDSYGQMPFHTPSGFATPRAINHNHREVAQRRPLGVSGFLPFTPTIYKS